MSRRPRIHAPGAFYHVTLRGNHRQPVFYRDEDRQLLNHIVSTTIDRFGAQVHAYCWMGNHIHLLVRVGEIPLGRFMLRVASCYARSVQTRLATTGHLFERRYHAILVDADQYLLTLLRYIHLNPVRAGLVSQPGEYPWSSHHAYSGQRPEPWVTTSFALRLMRLQQDVTAGSYQALMNDSPDRDSTSPFAKHRAGDDGILGGDDFRLQISQALPRPRPAMTLEQLIEDGCRAYAVNPAELATFGRDPRISAARAWIGHEAMTRRIASLSETARHLNRSESALRELIHRHYPPGHPQPR